MSFTLSHLLSVFGSALLLLYAPIALGQLPECTDNCDFSRTRTQGNTRVIEEVVVNID